MSRPIPKPRVWDESARTDDRRLWAAIMLALDVHVCASILEGRPVLACSLDGFALRHAMRGEALPPPSSYFRVRTGHLEALAEAEGAICDATRAMRRP
jgi:hypothetical protein